MYCTLSFGGKRMWFQNANSPIMEYLLFFHDVTFLLITIIALGIFFFIKEIFLPFRSHRLLIDNQEIEFIWTLTPCLVLFILTIPSLQLLYITDESNGVIASFKAIGHQWYWRYEWGEELNFDSYISSVLYRLLDVDNRISAKMGIPTRVFVSSTDVLHCWTVPVLGVKVDAVPGRLNQIFFSLNRPGLFFGQCSEICGSNHSFIPISIERIV